MRLWILPIAALAGFAFGCNKGNEGGTPGTHATFKVSLPGPASQNVKQGDTRTLDASIDRGSEFKKDVTLKVESPSKVDVKLGKDTIKASEGDTKFTIVVHPAKDAPLGDHVVKVTATPVGGGEPSSKEFTVNVTDGK